MQIQHGFSNPHVPRPPKHRHHAGLHEPGATYLRSRMRGLLCHLLSQSTENRRVVRYPKPIRRQFRLRLGRAGVSPLQCRRHAGCTYTGKHGSWAGDCTSAAWELDSAYCAAALEGVVSWIYRRTVGVDMLGTYSDRRAESTLS